VSDSDSQIVVPRSFIEVYLLPGKVKPTEPRHVIAARYEFCEDLAQMLIDTAQSRLFDLGITEHDVLERMHRGLLTEDAPVTPAEAAWVIRRLAELLEWPPLVLAQPASGLKDR
jgi:hypothetical protein